LKGKEGIVPGAVQELLYPSIKTALTVVSADIQN